MVNSEELPYRFGHVYSLRFGTPVNLSKMTNESSSFTSPIDLDKNLQNSKDKKNAYELTTHQISFTITKDSGKEPNKGEITIFNLSDDLVNYINNNIDHTLAIILEAGYKDEVKTIFKGTVAKISDKWERGTRETKLRCTDGGVNMGESMTSRSYPAGTPVKNVITDLSKDLGTTLGVIEISSDLSTFNSPVGFVGNTASQLQKITESINHNFSIQDGAIYITPRDKKLPQQSAYLSDETGLKSSPEPLSQGSKKSKKNKTPSDGLGFSCQLDGSILPETTVYVKSKSYEGALKVTKVVHTGSFEESDWTTKIQAVKIDATISK